MSRSFSLEQKRSAADLTHEQNQESFLELLREARLPVSDVSFARRDAKFHQGEELVANLVCPNGHEMSVSMRELRENLHNKFFNEESVVPHLCEKCAYPGAELASKKSTVYHRLALLSKTYPGVRYASGFDATGKGWETYQCGRAHADGTAHAEFQIRFDKLTLSAKSGAVRHVCYECGILAGDTPETKSKTVSMMLGRMKIISNAIKHASGNKNLTEPTVSVVENQDYVVDGSGAISTTKTLLALKCGDPHHPAVERSADSYFNVAKGGYCKACLKAAGVKSVSELDLNTAQ